MRCSWLGCSVGLTGLDNESHAQTGAKGARGDDQLTTNGARPCAFPFPVQEVCDVMSVGVSCDWLLFEYWQCLSACVADLF